MPDLRGLTVEQAETRLRAAGTRGSVDWREERCDAALPVGAVCSTYPWTAAAASAAGRASSAWSSFVTRSSGERASTAS